jgi:ribonuclease HIII
MGNLNRLLAWGHAKVIELLLARQPDCPRAVSDQFAKPAVLQRALGERGKHIELVQRTKAESDPAVAAASILAREKFIDWIAQQSTQLQITLPKGASDAVKAAGKELLSREGAFFLPRVAKMHFKTAQELLCSS